MSELQGKIRISWGPRTGRLEVKSCNQPLAADLHLGTRKISLCVPTSITFEPGRRLLTILPPDYPASWHDAYFNIPAPCKSLYFQRLQAGNLGSRCITDIQVSKGTGGTEREGVRDLHSIATPLKPSNAPVVPHSKAPPPENTGPWKRVRVCSFGVNSGPQKYSTS